MSFKLPNQTWQNCRRFPSVLWKWWSFWSVMTCPCKRIRPNLSMHESMTCLDAWSIYFSKKNILLLVERSQIGYNIQVRRKGNQKTSKNIMWKSMTSHISFPSVSQGDGSKYIQLSREQPIRGRELLDHPTLFHMKNLNRTLEFPKIYF